MNLLNTLNFRYFRLIGVGSALPSLILIAGTIVILFLLILAGAYDKRPLNEIFFLQADTKGIPNAPQGICHWTLYNVGLSPNLKYSFPEEVMGVQFIVDMKSFSSAMSVTARTSTADRTKLRTHSSPSETSTPIQTSPTVSSIIRVVTST